MRAQLGVHVRIVDDLADQERAAIRELGSRLVRVLHCPVHAVAEPELARQPEREVADRQGVIVGANRVDESAVVIGREGAVDGILEPESLAEVGLLHTSI